MSKFSLILLAACALAVPAAAQTKISGKQTCAKPDTQQIIPVGDAPGHALMVQRNSCTWDAPLEIAGLKSTTSVDVETDEAKGPNVTGSGYGTVTMDNGDTFTVKYSGTTKVAADGTAIFHGSWSFAKGSGKLADISGGGTYGGTGAADGSGSVDVHGTYTISKPAPKPVPAAKPAT